MIAALTLVVALGGTALFLSRGRALEAARQNRDDLLAFHAGFTDELLVELRRLGPSVAAVARITEAASAQLADLEQRAGDDPAVLIAIGRTHVDLAHVLGGGGHATVGAFDAASQCLDRAERIAEALRAGGHRSDALLRLEAGILGQRGIQLRVRSDPAGSHDAFRRALAIYEELAERAPDDFELRRMLAAALERAAGGHGDFGEMLSTHGRAIALLEELLRERPGDRRTGMLLSFVASSQAQLLFMMKRLDEALPLAERSVEVLDALCAADPDDRRARSERISGLRVLASLRLAAAQADEALGSVERGVSEASRILADDPDDFATAYEAGRCEMILGDACTRLARDSGPAEVQGWLARAREALAASRARLGELAERSPEHEGVRRHLDRIDGFEASVEEVEAGSPGGEAAGR